MKRLNRSEEDCQNSYNGNFIEFWSSHSLSRPSCNDFDNRFFAQMPHTCIHILHLCSMHYGKICPTCLTAISNVFSKVVRVEVYSVNIDRNRLKLLENTAFFGPIRGHTSCIGLTVFQPLVMMTSSSFTSICSTVFWPRVKMTPSSFTSICNTGGYVISPCPQSMHKIEKEVLVKGLFVKIGEEHG